VKCDKLILYIYNAYVSIFLMFYVGIVSNYFVMPCMCSLYLFHAMLILFSEKNKF